MGASNNVSFKAGKALKDAMTRRPPAGGRRGKRLPEHGLVSRPAYCPLERENRRSRLATAGGMPVFSTITQ